MPIGTPESYAVPLLDAVTIDHGPPDLLGRFFALADATMRNHGLKLAYCGDFRILRAINEDNRDSWYPLIPAFDSRGGATASNAYFFIAYDGNEIVATQVGRVYDVADSFTELCHSLRLMYDDPSKAPAGESCTLTLDAARAGDGIRGRVVFSGGTWCKPGKARGRGFASLLARLSRSFALARFGTDWTVSTVRMSHIAGGLLGAYGYKRLAYEWKWRSPVSPGAPSSKDDPIALVHMSREELLADLADHLPRLSLPSQAAE
ncbi:MAG: hypothetical protein FJX54_23455 [Alphaproteobacteria bacterium]|nr:hypothetical protein [Alphaproteobacteria bacterium]